MTNRNKRFAKAQTFLGPVNCVKAGLAVLQQGKVKSLGLVYDSVPGWRPEREEEDPLRLSFTY